MLDDPKVQRLSPTLFRAWVNLLCLASASDGKLPSIDDIAFKLRVSVQDAQQHIDELILAGLLDPTTDGLVPAQLAFTSVRFEQQHGTGQEAQKKQD